MLGQLGLWRAQWRAQWREQARAQARALGGGVAPAPPPPQRFRPRSVGWERAPAGPPQGGTSAAAAAALAGLAQRGGAAALEKERQRRASPAPGASATAGAGAGAGAGEAGAHSTAGDGQQQQQQPTQVCRIAAKRTHLELCKATNRRLVEAADTASVVAIVRAQGVVRLNHVNACTALHQVAKRCRASERPSAPELELLTELLVAKLHRFDARAVASSMWSLATLRHHPGDEVLDLLSSAVERTSVQFNSQAVANCLWAYATLGHVDAGALDLLCAVAQRELGGRALEGPRALPRPPRRPGSAEALALAPALRLPMAKLGTFNSQELANTVWALAKLKRSPGATLQRLLDDAVCWQVDEFKPQELANTLWAFVKLGHGDEAVLGVLECAVGRIAERLNAQELTQVLWSYAKLGRAPAPAQLAAITDCAQRELPYLTGQGLAIVLWAFAKLGCSLPPELIARFAGAVRREAAALDPFSIVNILWAFATMGVRDVCVLGRLDNAVVVRAEAFNAQDVANSIWAYARLFGAGYRTSDLVMEQLGAALERNIDSMTPQHVSSALWAYSYLKYNPGSSVLRALDVQVRKHSESEEGFRGPELRESFALIPDNAGPI